MKRIKQLHYPESNQMSYSEGYANGYAAGHHAATLLHNQTSKWAIEKKMLSPEAIKNHHHANQQWYSGYNAGLESAISAIKHQNEEN